jgi:hypothetical protein
MFNRKEFSIEIAPRTTYDKRSWERGWGAVKTLWSMNVKLRATTGGMDGIYRIMMSPGLKTSAGIPGYGVTIGQWSNPANLVCYLHDDIL